MKKQDESAADQQASLPVLVIEDNPALREQVATLLESGGYPVVWGDSKTDIPKWLSWRVMGIVSGIRTVEGMDLHEWLAQHFPQLTQRVVLVGTAPQVGPSEWPFVPTPSSLGELLPVIEKTMGKPEATERILMVDDEEPIREILANMLGFAGYRCCTFAGGGRAIEMLDSGDKFDLVTSDFHNSPMDGIEFLGQMKAKFPNIPFLMITAVHDVSIAMAAVRNGAYDYLLKPFERDQLLFFVRRALEYRRLKLENGSLRAQVEELAKTPSGGGKAVKKQ